MTYLGVSSLVPNAKQIIPIPFVPIGEQIKDKEVVVEVVRIKGILLTVVEVDLNRSLHPSRIDRSRFYVMDPYSAEMILRRFRLFLV